MHLSEHWACQQLMWLLPAKNCPQEFEKPLGWPQNDNSPKCCLAFPTYKRQIEALLLWTFTYWPLFTVYQSEGREQIVKYIVSLCHELLSIRIENCKIVIQVEEHRRNFLFIPSFIFDKYPFSYIYSIAVV